MGSNVFCLFSGMNIFTSWDKPSCYSTERTGSHGPFGSIRFTDWNMVVFHSKLFVVQRIIVSSIWVICLGYSDIDEKKKAHFETHPRSGICFLQFRTVGGTREHHATADAPAVTMTDKKCWLGHRQKLSPFGIETRRFAPLESMISLVVSERTLLSLF